MTDSRNLQRGRVNRGHDRGAVVTVGVVATALVGLLIVGGLNAAHAMTLPREVPVSKSAQEPATDLTGAKTPETDSSTPPDRDSDQNDGTQQSNTVYSVKRGDTLTLISARVGVSVDAIAGFNGIRDLNVISEGATLRIPLIYIPPAG